MNVKAFHALLLVLALTACADTSFQRQAVEEKKEKPKLSLFHPTPQDAPILRASAPHPPHRGSGPLAGFFAELAALEGGQRWEPLLILQLGDSHTASDVFSGRLRQRFQAQFGNAGRGQLPPAVPFDYFRPHGVRITASPGWIVSKADSRNSAGLFGISGFRARATKAGDRVSLVSDEPDGFDTLLLTALRQPLGGTFELEIDGQMSSLPTLRGDRPEVVRIQVSTPPGSRQAVLTARGDGLVDLLAWGPQRQKPGIVLEAHGVIGATIQLIRRFDPMTAGFELTSRRAALILIAFGTNEGFQDGWSAEAYLAEAAAALADLRRLAPDSDIAILGPPDGNRLVPSGCRSAAASPCFLLGGGLAGKQSTAKKKALCRWTVPPNLSMVRQMLARLAQSENFYFWDWSQVMGACGADRWAQMKPPLAGQDRIHYRPDGYVRAADALYDQLMLEYAAWKHAVGVQ